MRDERRKEERSKQGQTMYIYQADAINHTICKFLLCVRRAYRACNNHQWCITGSALWLHTIGFGTRSSCPQQSLVEQNSRQHTCTPQCPIWRKTGERGGCGGPPSIPPYGASGLRQNSLPQSLIKFRLLLPNGRTGGGRQADYQAAVYSTTKAGEEGEARGRVGWVGGGGEPC